MAWINFKKNTPPNVTSTILVAKSENHNSRREGHENPRTPPNDIEKPSRATSDFGVSSLDAIGQRNETVRFRIGEMSDRLEDLKSLQADFSAILEPIVAIADELPRAKVRISELEALLVQEQGSVSTMRRELADVTQRFAKSGNDLTAALAQIQHLEASLHDRDEAVEGLRVHLRDRSLAAENLERQLFAETEQSRTLAAESKALRIEAKSIDQALSRSESELVELRERRNVLEQDNKRLQILSEDQGGKLVELVSRCHDLEGQAETFRQAQRTLEQQLAAESSARENAEAQYETEIAGYRTERSSLAMRIEATTARLATTEQLLAQLRNQLRERDEAGRVAERGLKEAAIERLTLERRLESTQSDLARQTERFLEMQRLHSEVDHRCEMLVKAMAAKDAAIEQATSRAASLSDRIDQLVRRQEIERADFETVNHRLVEELHNERSERKLAQGALDIARESRVSLQKQHEALRRTSRGFREPDAVPQAEASGQSPVATPPEESNVRPFAPADKGL